MAVEGVFRPCHLKSHCSTQSNKAGRVASLDVQEESKALLSSGCTDCEIKVRTGLLIDGLSDLTMEFHPIVAVRLREQQDMPSGQF